MREKGKDILRKTFRFGKMFTLSDKKKINKTMNEQMSK